MKEDKKKVFIRTMGCQMNEYDSELIRSILTGAGYLFVEKVEDADVVILNTCSVRENALRKVYGHIHAIRHLLKGKSVLIGILGCMATHLKEELIEDRKLKIDFVVGPDSYRELPEIIQKCRTAEGKAWDVDLSDLEMYEGITPLRENGVNAWIAIMRGCNNFCTFCVVPYTRGRERSRSLESILTEVRAAALKGYKQVTLLGQNVNSYSSGETDFAELLSEVSAVEGIARIRFMSPHPKDFLDKVIDLIATNPKICPHIHLPLQAGSDRILKMMNRTYTQEAFLNLVAKIRRACPQAALTTDIIVGFPNETDDEFADTVKVMREVEFDAAFIFKYSPRKLTLAMKRYPDDVPEEVKTERIVLLNNLQKEISLKKNTVHIGSVEEILIESLTTTKSGNETQGRAKNNKLVIIPAGPYRVGDLVNVQITGATPHILKGLPI